MLKAILADLRAQSVRTICEEGTLPAERALGVKLKELVDTRGKASVSQHQYLTQPRQGWDEKVLDEI